MYVKPKLYKSVNCLHHSVISWLAMTGFLIAAFILQVPKGYHQNLVVLGVLYLAFSLIFLSRHITAKNMSIQNVWEKDTLISRCNPPLKNIIYAITTLAIISAIVFGLPERPGSSRVDRLIPFFGFLIFLFGMCVTSVVS